MAITTRYEPVEAAKSQIDWVIALLPTAIAFHVFSRLGSLVLIGLLTAVAFLRRPDGNFRVQLGPLVTLLAASAIVLSRPASIGALVTFVLVSAIAARIIISGDRRKIISSLIDGCGIYAAANVLLFATGIISPSANLRIGGLVEEGSGFERVVFPLTWSVNASPIVAAVYIAALPFLIRVSSRSLRAPRLLLAVPAAYMLYAAGSRVALSISILLPVLILVFPSVIRWIAQASAVAAAISAFVWPAVVESIRFIIQPLAALAPGRQDQDAESIGSLNGRDFIWGQSINYWREWVNDLPHILLGFGVNGQYRSGASMTYREWISAIVRNPEKAYVHNSFLQQLFDGGVIGWLLFAIATFWASSRLSRNLRQDDYSVVAGVVALAVLALTAVTEAFMAPGVGLESFWVLIILVAASCQSTLDQTSTHLAGLRQDPVPSSVPDRRRATGL